MDNSTITCDKIIVTYDEETNFNEKKTTSKTQNLVFASIFINYYSIIDSC